MVRNSVMAKARTTDMVSRVDSTADTLLVTTRDEGIRKVLIEIPLTEQPPPTEFVFHVDCKLTPQQSTVARRIAQQLDCQNECLNNGQRIVNVHGALKWLLEQIAKQA